MREVGDCDSEHVLCYQNQLMAKAEQGFVSISFRYDGRMFKRLYSLRDNLLTKLESIKIS